eukprot:18169-Amphidinium_carterae.1
MDFYCLPQSPRNDEDEEFFKASLAKINYLYLGMQVLVLYDQQYAGRFWTSYEVFLATHRADVQGVITGGDRHVIQCLGAARMGNEKANAEALLAIWADKSPLEASNILASPDVLVTNQKDKDQQLKKLQNLNEEVQGLCLEIQQCQGLSGEVADLAVKGWSAWHLKVAGFSVYQLAEGFLPKPHELNALFPDWLLQQIWPQLKEEQCQKADVLRKRKLLAD